MFKQFAVVIFLFLVYIFCVMRMIIGVDSITMFLKDMLIFVSVVGVIMIILVFKE